MLAIIEHVALLGNLGDIDWCDMFVLVHEIRRAKADASHADRSVQRYGHCNQRNQLTHASGGYFWIFKWDVATTTNPLRDSITVAVEAEKLEQT